MTQFGKSIVLFAGAAIMGGIVAFLIGNSETQNPTPNGKPNHHSESVLLKKDLDTKDAPPSIPNPESSLPHSIQSAPPPQPGRTSHDRGVENINEEALKHLRYLKTLDSTQSGNSASEAQAQQSLERALEKLLDHLRQSEVTRSQLSRRDTEGVISTLVKITPPTAIEIATLKELLPSLAKDLPLRQQAQFQNRSLQFMNQFLFDPEKVLVVYITQQFPDAPSQKGNFHSHLTKRPDDFWHHHNGEQLGVPQGESTWEAGPISTPLSPDFRFFHFASQ
jgi:hypothetical protein